MKENGAAYDEVIRAFIDDNSIIDAEKDLNVKEKLSNIGVFLSILHEELLRAQKVNGGNAKVDYLDDSNILPFRHIQKTIENKVQSVQF